MQDINKVSRLLHCEELQLNTRRILLCNYFQDICKVEEISRFLDSPSLNPILKRDIVNYYGRPLYRWDEDVQRIAVALLDKILRNPQDFDVDLVGTAIVVSASYDRTYILDNIHKYIDYVSDKQGLYGALADYLINIIANNSHHLSRIIEKLSQHMTSFNKHRNISAKLLLDTIYRYYRSHPSFEADGHLQSLLHTVTKAYHASEIEALLREFMGMVKCKSIIFYDINERFRTLHYNAGINDSFIKNKDILPLQKNNPITISIDDTAPMFLLKEEVLLSNLGFSDSEHDNILILPCLYFGKVNSILVLFDCYQNHNTTILYSFIFAKYLAGAINKFREDLNIFRIVEKVYEDHALLVRGLRHDLEHPLSNVACFLADLKMRNQIDPEGLLSCEQSCTVIGKTLDDIVSFHSIKKESRNLKSIIDIVLSALMYIFRTAKVSSEFHHDDTCPDIMTPSSVFRAFQNIIHNAAENLSKKDSFDRKIIVTTQYDSQNSVIRVHIRDNGTGIPPSVMEDLFAPSTNISGRGLGLPMASNTFEMMGGELSVLKTDDSGTTFEIILKV